MLQNTNNLIHQDQSLNVPIRGKVNPKKQPENQLPACYSTRATQW